MLARFHVFRPLPVLPFRGMAMTMTHQTSQKGASETGKGEKWENPFAVFGIGNFDILHPTKDIDQSDFEPGGKTSSHHVH